MDEQQKNEYKYLRNNYESFLVTGPFSIIVSYDKGLMALNDRLKLRSLVVGTKDDMVYMASEEEAIRVIAPDLDSIYFPKGGEPYIVELDEEVR